MTGISTQGANTGTIPLAEDANTLNDLLGWNFDPVICTAGSNSISAATIYLFKIGVPKTITITNIVASVIVAGANYSNAQFGLYSSAGVLLSSTAVMATGGTDTLGTTGTKAVALASPQTIQGGPDVFVWAAIHVGAGAGVPVFQTKPDAAGISNIGTTNATYRFGSQPGHATNNLATIGNLTPAANNGADSFPWVGLS